MKKLKDKNLMYSFTPIWIWLAVAILMIIISMIFMTQREIIYKEIINFIYEKGMIDELTKSVIYEVNKLTR